MPRARNVRGRSDPRMMFFALLCRTNTQQERCRYDIGWYLDVAGSPMTNRAHDVS